MIHTYSLLQGYVGSLGLMPIRLGIAIGMLFVLPVPVEELKYFHLKDMQLLWNLQFAVHLIAALISILNLYFQHMMEAFELIVKVLSILTTLPLIFVYMWQFQTFLLLFDESGIPKEEPAASAAVDAPAIADALATSVVDAKIVFPYVPFNDRPNSVQMF